MPSTSQRTVVCICRFFVDNSFEHFHLAALQPSDTEPEREDDTLTASFEYKNDGFECAMTVSWRNENNNNETTDYSMFAYSGTRSFGGFMDAHIETCGLTAYKRRGGNRGNSGFASSNSNTVVYYDPPKNLVTITSIAIAARSPDLGVLPIPSTLDAHSYPLTNDHYTFSKRTVTVGDRKMLEIHMELTKPVANLITFGIYKLPRRTSQIPAR